jgi:hypothetical protein
MLKSSYRLRTTACRTWQGFAAVSAFQSACDARFARCEPIRNRAFFGLIIQEISELKINVGVTLLCGWPLLREPGQVVCIGSNFSTQRYLR